MVEICKSVKPLRSGNQGILIVPKSGTKSYGGRIFSYGAATLWNDLHSQYCVNNKDGLCF